MENGSRRSCPVKTAASAPPKITISDAGGMWRLIDGRGVPGRRNPCVGKEFPLTVQARSDAEIAFKVKATKVMPGCKDLSVTVKAVDSTTLEGDIRNGGPIRLVRQ